MIQDPGRPRFLLEATETVGILRKRRGQDLDRHLAPEPRITRSVDLSHSARAERREDFVRAEPGSRL